MSRPSPNRSYPSAYEPGVDPRVLQERLDRHYELCSRCKWDSTRCLNDPENCIDFEEIGKPRVERLSLILAIIFVVVLIILLLSRMNAADRGTSTITRNDTVTRNIERLDKPVYKGVVAVWLEPEGKIEYALASVGLGGAETKFESSDGKYVIAVDPGTESTYISKLKQTAGVVDAGFVYKD